MIEKAGAHFRTGIGWQQKLVYQRSQRMCLAAFTCGSLKKLKSMQIPVIASNRINTPEVAEQILKQGQSDLISMASLVSGCWFWSEGVWRENLSWSILAYRAIKSLFGSYFFKEKKSCLRTLELDAEMEFPFVTPTLKSLVQRNCRGWAGPSGMTAACTLAARGYHVPFVRSTNTNWPFIWQKSTWKEAIPETFAYFENQRGGGGGGGFFQTTLGGGGGGGVLRQYYWKVKFLVGNRVAIMAGGIGFDVAKFVLQCAVYRKKKKKKKFSGKQNGIFEFGKRMGHWSSTRSCRWTSDLFCFAGKWFWNFLMQRKDQSLVRTWEKPQDGFIEQL